MLDYTTVTEVPGLNVTRENVAMAYSRYQFARPFCEGRDVLEVACGAGLGLRFLARHARRIVGGDCSETLLQRARSGEASGGRLVRLDAEALPFRAGTFDTILLYEALYYLPRAERFFREARRVLRRAGTVLVCSVNPEWDGFIPSPFSTHYFDAAALGDALRRLGFHVSLFGAFAARNGSARDHLTDGLKRAAVRAGLMPRTLKGRQFLKRVFLGALVPLPGELCDGLADYVEPQPLTDSSPHYKIIYAVARPD